MKEEDFISLVDVPMPKKTVARPSVDGRPATGAFITLGGGKPGLALLPRGFGPLPTM